MENNMIGLGSLTTALAFWLSLASAAGCVLYGIWKWNDNGTPDTVRAGIAISPAKKP